MNLTIDAVEASYIVDALESMGEELMDLAAVQERNNDFVSAKNCKSTGKRYFAIAAKIKEAK